MTAITESEAWATNAGQYDLYRVPDRDISHGIKGTCRCGHAHPRAYISSKADATRCLDCACLHFVPTVVTLRPIPEHRPRGLRA